MQGAYVVRFVNAASADRLPRMARSTGYAVVRVLLVYVLQCMVGDQVSWLLGHVIRRLSLRLQYFTHRIYICLDATTTRPRLQSAGRFESTRTFEVYLSSA